MTGLDSNLEALAEKEYRQDEVLLREYERVIANAQKWQKGWELVEQEYTEKILEIQKKRRSHEQR